jgi:hypothetical protein
MEELSQPKTEKKKERSIMPGTYEISNIVAQGMLLLYWQKQNAGMMSTVHRNEIYGDVWTAGFSDGTKEIKSYACAYRKYVERAQNPDNNLPTEFIVTQDEDGNLDLRELETVFRHVEDIYFNELKETGEETVLFYERTVPDKNDSTE